MSLQGLDEVSDVCVRQVGNIEDSDVWSGEFRQLPLEEIVPCCKNDDWRSLQSRHGTNHFDESPPEQSRVVDEEEGSFRQFPDSLFDHTRSTAFASVRIEDLLSFLAQRYR